MTDISRRGFLFTVSTALAGTAVTFDPLKALWVPQGASVEVDEAQMALTDLALRYAKVMGERVADMRATIISELVGRKAVWIRQDGLIQLAAASRPQRGYFKPGPRLMKSGPLGATDREVHTFLRGMAEQMTRDIGRQCRMNAYAPIGTDLRRGVPFTNTAVAVATDPATGLTVRALRYKQLNDSCLHTGVELVGGAWYPKREV